MIARCWICDSALEDDDCPKCGGPQYLGPTPEEVALEHQRRELVDTFDDTERHHEREPDVDPQTGWVP